MKNFLFLILAMLMSLTLNSFGQDKETYYKCVSDTYIHSNMGVPFKVIDELNKDANIKVLGVDSLFNNTYKNWDYYYRVIDGWVLKEKLMSKTEVEKAEKVRLNILTKKYGYSNAKKIIAHLIWIGMSEAMCKESRGIPDHINTHTYSFGVHEQWIYKENYIYFKDNICTSFSTR